jgi:hypothetical protein
MIIKERPNRILREIDRKLKEEAANRLLDAVYPTLQDFNAHFVEVVSAARWEQLLQWGFCELVPSELWILRPLQDSRASSR